MSGWLPLGRPQMPAKNELVLVFCEPDVVAMKIWNGERFVDNRGRVFDCDPAKWMPIPSPIEEDTCTRVQRKADL